MWTPHLAASGKPVFQLIADAMEADIASKRLLPGEQLPTHRELARKLNLTVRTVTRAYSEAERRGLAAGQIGRGTFVRGDIDFNRSGPAPERRIVDLSSSTPPVSAAAASIPETLRALAGGPGLETLLSYPPSAGTARHRAAGAAWLSRRDWRIAPEQVVICLGAQHALMVALGTVATSGSVVLTEALNYPGIRRAAEFLRLDLRGVPIDEEGMQPDALDALIRAHRPAAVVVTPTAHNPTCATMSESRREAIAAVLNAHATVLIEDDLCSPLAAPGATLLSQMVERRAFYIGGTSKCIAPGLRIAYLAAAPHEVPQLVSSVYASAVAAPALMAEIATLWIENGTAERQLDWHRREARERLALAEKAFAGLDFRAQAGCYHIWLPLTAAGAANDLVAQSAARGLVVTPAAAFAIGSDIPNAVRIGLGATQNQSDLAAALGTLASIARSSASDGWHIV